MYVVKKDNINIIVTETRDYPADIIVLSSGVAPNSQLGIAAGLTAGDNGGLRVNKYLQTSDNRIYAVGDCVESINLITNRYSYFPLGSVATKMGRIVADNIHGKKNIYPGSIGTIIFKTFDIS